MRHPLQFLPVEYYKVVFLSLLAATIAIMVIITLVSTPLTTTAAPLGVVSFELAGSVNKAQEILASWDTEAQLRAAFSLGLDYLFMPAYSLTIGLACLWAAQVIHSRRWPLAALGLVLAWGLSVAAISDGIENIALTTMLFNVVSFPWPQVSYWCATVKFLLIFAGLVYAFYGAVIRLVFGR